MGAGGTFRNFRDFEKKFKADMSGLKNRIDKSLTRAAERAAEQARAAAPVASGFLRDSIHAVGLRVVCDAPYALAVELGSRPHWPPIQPILNWVALKGFVGVGTQTPESIAWAIATKISREGTRPTFFMRGMIPATLRFVGVELTRALRSG